MNTKIENPMEQTKTEEQIQKELASVVAAKNKNERLSFKRKYDKMQEMIEHEVRPLEASMLLLVENKMRAMDRVEDLRKQMVKECVHPKNHLVHKGNHVECKFCNGKISIPKQ